MTDTDATEPLLRRRADAPELPPAVRRSIPGITVPDAPLLAQPHDHRHDGTGCMFCNSPFSALAPAALVPGTATVTAHQACINASTIGMKAVTVLVEPEPDSIEARLLSARDRLDAALHHITVSEVELVGLVLEAQSDINEALHSLHGSTDLVTGA